MKKILGHGTIKNYFTTAKYLEEFVSAQFKKQDTYLTELDYQFITKFEYLFKNLCP